MTQDTRKDKRAKIVSLNVRYKSATVDEFIENHSHDVSKGGLFIKTPTPFPPGTLIKFEIRIAGDKSVIAGVGRVVWKREAGQAAGERPAGMGVKFIKIDDASRTLIDRVVLEKSDAGREYDENPADAIVIGPEVTAAAEAHDRAAGPQHKATMMGLGSVGGTPAARTAPGAQPARAAGGGGGMFPATNSIADMPEKKERTVMKQAAELLEEALKEAGGSMDDVGSNPLFAAAKPVGPSAIVEPPREAPKSTLIGMPAARDVVSDRLEAAPRAPANLSAMSSEAMKREAGAAAAIAKSVPHEPAREAPYVEGGIGGLGGIAGGGGGIAARGPTMEDEVQPTSRQRKTDPPARRSRPASAVVAIEEEPRPAKKGGSALLWVGLIVVAGAGAAYFYKDTLLGAPPPPPVTAATATATAIPPTIPPPASAATPTSDTTAAGAATAAPAPSGADAGLVRDAGTSAVAPPAASVTAAPTVAPPPTPATARPTPRPRPVATPPAEGATAAPPPKPKPAPKPASTDDDNPY